MCPVRDVPCRSGAGWPKPLLPALRTRRRDALQRVSAERGSHFAPDVRGSAPYVRSERDGRLPAPVYAEVPPPVEYALAPHGPGPMPRIRNLVERAGRTWRKSSRAAVRTPRRPAPLARQPLPRRAAFRCSLPFPARCIPDGIPPYPAAKSRNRTFVPLPTTV